MCDRTCKTFLHSASVCVREREGLVVLPSSSTIVATREPPTHSVLHWTSSSSSSFHFCHSAVTYIHYTSTLVLKNKRKIEYEKFTKKGLGKSLPNMSRLWIFAHKGGTNCKRYLPTYLRRYLLCHGCTMLGCIHRYQHRNIGKVTKYR